MFNQRNEKEKVIMQIVNLSKNIKCLYDNMNVQNKDSLEKELRIEVAKENMLLDSLNINEKNSKEIYLDFVNLLNESLLDDFKFELKDPSLQNMFYEYMKITNSERIYTNDLILTRFESYLIKKFKANPTKSKEIIDDSKRRKENRATINHAAVIDYLTNTTKFLNELEENTSSLAIANKAIEERNRILFTDKLIEEKYINNDLSITKYEECLNNGFKKEYVDEIYENFIADAINEQGRHCYLYSNKMLEDKTNIAKVAVDFQILKASLYLLDKEALKKHLMNYQTINKNGGKKSVQMMIASMQEIIEIKENEKSLVKTKKVI